MKNLVSPETKISLLYTMLKIRRFEEKIIDLYPEQEMKTPVHLYIGQEGVAAAVCANLSNEDYIFSTHRNHGHFIAKGIDLRAFMAELYGKETGCARGKGGSMHCVEPGCGILGVSAIVGGSLAIAAGAGLSIRMKKEPRVVAVFFGDGAVDEGTFHEVLNFAALKKLPVVFICENNFYATNSHQSVRQSRDNIDAKAFAYGMPSSRIEGDDVLGIYKLAKDAVAAARNGEGPSFIECRTYRFRGHVGPECDYEKGCRPKEELESWMEKCPVKTYSDLLTEKGIVNRVDISVMVSKIDLEIEEAVRFAKESFYPKAGELFDDVYYKGK